MQFLNFLSKKKLLLLGLFLVLKKCSFLRYFGTIRIREGYSKIHIPDLMDSFGILVKQRFGDTLVIKIRYPGLGDHLFYSTLPEFLIKNKIFQYIYISNQSKYRFEGMKELIWQSNPYISGFIDGEGWSHSGIRPQDGNFVDGIEILFNHDDYIRGRSPLLYIDKSKFLLEQKLLGKVYVDLSSLSNRDTPDFEKIVFYLSRYEKNLIVLTEPRNYCGSFFDEFEKISLPKTITEYCGYLISCNKYYCLYSGGNSLAPALNIQANVFVKKIDLAQSYKKNNYITLN